MNNSTSMKAPVELELVDRSPLGIGRPHPDAQLLPDIGRAADVHERAGVRVGAGVFEFVQLHFAPAQQAGQAAILALKLRPHEVSRERDRAALRGVVGGFGLDAEYFCFVTAWINGRFLDGRQYIIEYHAPSNCTHNLTNSNRLAKV
jgi:hypothetical protein